MSNKLLKDILEAYRNGDHITTPDMVRLSDQCKQASDLLIHLGPEFYLACKELNSLYLTIDSYINARNNK